MKHRPFDEPADERERICRWPEPHSVGDRATHPPLSSTYPLTRLGHANKEGSHPHSGEVLGPDRPRATRGVHRRGQLSADLGPDEPMRPAVR